MAYVPIGNIKPAAPKRSNSMSWLGLAGAGISALGSLLGGRSAQREARKTRRMQQAQFDAAMDETIQRRVADARMAGIHPLAALGSSPGAGPTITGAGLGAEGDAISRAGAAVGSAVAQRRLSAAQLDEVNSRTDLNEATAAYYRSEAARRATTSPGTSGGQLDQPTAEPVSEVPAYQTPIKPTRDKEGYETGRGPAVRKERLPDGRYVKQFTGQADEVNQAWLLGQLAKYGWTDAVIGLEKWIKRKTGVDVGYLAAAERRRKVKKLFSEYRDPYMIMAPKRKYKGARRAYRR